MYDYRAVDAAWSRLPDAEIPTLRAKWIGPLVDRGFDGWIGDLSEGAYGTHEHCGWLSAIDDLPPMLDEQGSFATAWIAAIRQAADLLADAGSYAGPESSADRWTSWLLWELAEPHAWLRERMGP